MMIKSNCATGCGTISPPVVAKIEPDGREWRNAFVLAPQNMNAELIKQGMVQRDRLAYVNNMAIEQMRSLIKSATVQRLNETLNTPPSALAE